MQFSLSDIAHTIEKSYLEHLDQLDPVAQRHLLYRLYVSSKSLESKQRLLDIGGKFTESQLPFIHTFNQNFSSGLLGQREDIAQHSSDYPHLARRLEIWKQYPELVYFYTVLRESFYLRFFGIDFHLDEQRITDLFTLTMSTPSFIQNSSTHALCIIFYLDYLGLLPVINGQSKWDYVKQILQEFSIDSSSSDVEVYNYLYALNHIVICDSYFYLRKPEDTLFTYAAEIEKYTSLFYERLSLDLRIESLLSCQLLDSHSGDFSQLVEKDILANFDHSLRIVDNKKIATATYQSAEHTNALCIMIARIDFMTSHMGELRI